MSKRCLLAAGTAHPLIWAVEMAALADSVNQYQIDFGVSAMQSYAVDQCLARRCLLLGHRTDLHDELRDLP